jgi:hypothetical protein
VHPDGTGALKKRGTGSGKVPGRLEHEDTYNGSRQPMCCRVYSVRGRGFRCWQRTAFTGRHRAKPIQRGDIVSGLLRRYAPRNGEGAAKEVLSALGVT